MALSIVRGAELGGVVRVRQIGRGADDTYVLFDGDAPRWGVTIEWRWATLPFYAELVWPAAGVAVIGGSQEVYCLDLETADTRLQLQLDGYFGYLVLDRDSSGEEILFVLGCEDIHAYRPSLDLRWHAKDVAADGITFNRIDGDRLWVNAEMDPPGGWFAVEIDLATGKELSRHPKFSDDYLTRGD